MATFSNESYDARNYLKSRPNYPSSLFSYLREYTGVPETEKLPIVVDLGCGPGEASAELARTTGEKVFGVDPSAVMLSQAKENTKDLGSRVDFIVGNDQTLTAQFAKHSVDLVTVAEAAHWFTYPDFWEAVHYVLKPGGTLAIWAYYFFTIEGHPESEEIFKQFSLSKEKCGPYWGSGQSLLNTLYSDLEMPENLYEKPQRIVSDLTNLQHKGPFELRRENVKVSELVALLSTYSAYHTWKKENPGKPDILQATVDELLSKTGLTLDSRVNVKWASVLMLGKAKPV